METFIITVMMEETETGVTADIRMTATLQTAQTFGPERMRAFYDMLVPSIETAIRGTLTAKREKTHAG